MLSRTADHLFWMARYTERAENTARMLTVNLEAAMMSQVTTSPQQSWEAPLRSAELQSQFNGSQGELSATEVMGFMALDEHNPSSIVSCLRRARENAHAVRGVLPSELWETINATWLMLQRHIEAEFMANDGVRFFEWVRYRSHLSRGVAVGTMLRDEAFHFIRLGTFLERADNTARILDLKFHEETSASENGNSPQADFYYWAALLRSLSAFEIYRKAYRDVITPPRVAELLILRGDMPRSLLACLDELVAILAKVRNRASGETERLAGQLHAELRYADIETILTHGLHQYLTDFLTRMSQIGQGLSRDFLTRTPSGVP
jgi:uncharacterized alpha-E superfamily protein